jgi:hypothetical protein
MRACNETGVVLADNMDQFSNDVFTPQGVESAAKRQKDRDSLLLVAGLRVDGRPGMTQVRIRNLSSGGLMAEYAHPLDIGKPVEIDVRGIGKVAGQVAWSAAGRLGISFDAPIDPMQARKPVVAPKNGPIKDKPIKPIL